MRRSGKEEDNAHEHHPKDGDERHRRAENTEVEGPGLEVVISQEPSSDWSTVNNPLSDIFVISNYHGLTHPYATYSATMDSENTALIADGPANDSKPRRIANAQVKKTVLTGVFV